MWKTTHVNTPDALFRDLLVTTAVEIMDPKHQMGWLVSSLWNWCPGDYACVIFSLEKLGVVVTAVLSASCPLLGKKCLIYRMEQHIALLLPYAGTSLMVHSLLSP